MVILIAGASHTGKTLLAQRLMERFSYPYLSIDHLKMGLIRSGYTDMTVLDDEQLIDYLWPVLREMIKTVIENGQNLIVEGCYIPFDWEASFPPSYREQIHGYWLIMTEDYIENHFDMIAAHANDIEQRLDDSGCSKQWLIEENLKNLDGCRNFGCQYILIDENYEIGELPCLM